MTQSPGAVSRRVLLSAALVAALSAGTVTHGADAAPAVTSVRMPDGGIHPQAAVDAAGRIHLVYFKGEPGHGDAYYARSDDGGATFGRPVRVNSHPQSVIVAGTVRGPHLALGRGGRPHVAWMGSAKAEPKAGGTLAPMLYTRLNDAGDGFEPQRNVVSAHPGLDGGGSVAADADGRVYVAWHAPMDHARKDGEQGRHVWVAASADDGKTFAPEVAANPVPSGVCACCGMRVFADAGGRVLVLYRSASEMVNRDVQLLLSQDRGATFAAAATDPWKIAQCVMSTAAFARTPAGDVLAAWETKGQIRTARVAAAAATAGEPVDAPGGGKGRKHPSLAVNHAGDALLAWTEGTGWNKGGSVAWQVFDRDGRPVAGRSGRAAGLPAWGVPAAVALPDGTFRVFY